MFHTHHFRPKWTMDVTLKSGYLEHVTAVDSAKLRQDNFTGYKNEFIC